MRNGYLVAGVMMLTTGWAQAEPVTGKAAKALLFSPKGTSVEVIKQPFLTDADLKVIAEVAGQQKYYAAVAMSPDEGLLVEATVAGANFHDTDSASAFALAGCEAKRKGDTPCVVVAIVRPKGWEPQPLQLSVDATDAARKDYAKAPAPKAMATSASTGQWAIGSGSEAAVAACAAKSAASDCIAVLAD